MKRIFLTLFFMLMGAIIQVAFSTIGGISADLVIWWLWLFLAIVLLCGGTSVLTIIFVQARGYAKTTGGADDYADMCRNERAKVMKDLARYDDSDYVMARPVKPVAPLVVMRREPGAKWQVVEDNR